MNAIFFGEIRGRGQKSSAYSEGISVMEFYLPVLSLHFLWSILFIFCVLASEGRNAIVFGRDKGEKSEVSCLLERYTIQKRKMIYCHNIVVNLSYTMIAAISSYQHWQHRGDSIRISHNLLSPSPSLSSKTIAFIPSGAKTQKKEITPYPRCGFGACLRCEWAS